MQRPARSAETQEPEFRWDTRQLLDRVIDPQHECLGPIPRRLGQRRRDPWNGARQVQCPQQPIEPDAGRTDQLRQTALGDMPHDLHLRPTQMDVQRTQRDRQVMIGLRLDEGNVVRIPVHHHSSL